MKAGSEAVWSSLRGITAHVQVTEDMALWGEGGRGGFALGPGCRPRLMDHTVRRYGRVR